MGVLGAAILSIAISTIAIAVNTDDKKAKIIFTVIGSIAEGIFAYLVFNQ